jgi:hypothetical protein
VQRLRTSQSRQEVAWWCLQRRRVAWNRRVGRNVLATCWNRANGGELDYSEELGGILFAVEAVEWLVREAAMSVDC